MYPVYSTMLWWFSMPLTFLWCLSSVSSCTSLRTCSMIFMSRATSSWYSLPRRLIFRRRDSSRRFLVCCWFCSFSSHPRSFSSFSSSRCSFCFLENSAYNLTHFLTTKSQVHIPIMKSSSMPRRLLKGFKTEPDQIFRSPWGSLMI